MDNEFEMEDEDEMVEGAVEDETETDEEADDLVDQGAAAERLLDDADFEGLAEGGAGAAARAAAEALGEGVAEGLGAAAGKETINKQELINKLERIGKLENNMKDPEAMLSRTERMLLNNLHGALKSGDMKSVQDMLATIAENPKTVASVMNAMKARLEGSNPLNHVSWEQGKDNNGNAFVRLTIDQNHSASKSSGSTRVMIGSDGTNVASSNKTWDSPRTNIDPADALRDVTTPVWRNLKPFEFKPNEMKPHQQGVLQDLIRGGAAEVSAEKKK